MAGFRARSLVRAAALVATVASMSSAAAAQDCTLTVIEPDGGEVLTIGEATTISWSATGSACPTEVWIQLRKGYQLERYLTAEPVANDGDHPWTVAGDVAPGDDYTVMVADPSFTVFDESSFFFTIQVALEADFSHEPFYPVAHEPVQFTDRTAGSPPETWSWDFGDGGSSVERHPTHTFSEPGLFDVCLTVTRGLVASTRCLGVGVVELAAKFVWTPPEPVVGETVHFADWSVGPPYAWVWDFGDDAESGDRHPTHTYASAGDWRVCQAVSRGGLALDQECRWITVVEEAPCGDGLCQLGEEATCGVDCAPVACGDLVCHASENHLSCPQDCRDLPECGNGVCELGETSWSCEDCAQAPDATARTFSACTSCFVPAVVLSPGVDADDFWLSEAMLVNVGTDPAMVSLVYSPDDGRPETAFGPFLLGSEEAGYFANLAQQLFDEAGNASLRIEADRPLMMTSRAFNDRPDGTFGQLIGAWSPAQSLGQEDKAYISGIRHNEGFRTNVLVQEVSGRKTFVLLSVYDRGTRVGTITESVEANRKLQIGLAAQGFDDITSGHIVVEVISGGRVAALASVVDNSTGDPYTVAAVEQNQVLAPSLSAKTGEAHFLVAAVAHAAGEHGSLWRSSGTVQNPFSAAQELRLEYHPKGGQPQQTEVSIGAEELISWDDIVAELFPGLDDGSGALHLYAPVGVILNTTTYNLNLETGGTYGQFIPGLAGGDLFTVGEVGWLVDLQHDVGMRTNIGLAEYEGVETTVEVTVFGTSEWGLDATRYPPRRITVSAMGWNQPSLLNAILGDDLLRAGCAKVEVVSGGRVYIYASKIDNRTGDPTFIPAQRQP